MAAENYQDLAALASKLQTYDGAWDIVMSFVAPIQEALIQYGGPLALAVAILTMIYHTATLRPQKTILWFVYLGVCGAMFIPITVQVGAPSSVLAATGGGGEKAVRSGGAANISAVFYWTNYVLDGIAGEMMGAIDKGLGGYGDGRNMAAPLQAVAAARRGYFALLPGSSALEIFDDYRAQCGGVGQAIIANAPQDGNVRDTVSRLGLLANSYPDPDITPPKEFADRLASRAPAKLLSGKYHVENVAYWGDRFGVNYDGSPGAFARAFAFLKSYVGIDGDDSPKLLTTAALPALKYKSNSDTPAENEAGVPSEDFYPKNCYEMYQLAKLAFQEFDNGTKTATVASLMYNSRGGGIMPVWASPKVVIEIAKAAQRCGYDHLESLNEKSGNSGGWDSLVNWGASKLMGTPTDWLTTLKKIDANVYTLVFPAILALITGAAMIVFPIVVVMSIASGRETALPNFLLTLIYIKLTLVFTYFILKVGGLIGTAAVISAASSPHASNMNTESICGLAATTLPVTLIAALVGAPLLAWVVTFNDKAGLRGLGFRAFGAPQMLSTGLKVAGAAAFAAGGAGRLVAAATRSMAKSGNPPASPTGGAGGPVAGHAPGGGSAPTINNLRSKTQNNNNKKLRQKNLWK